MVYVGELTLVRAQHTKPLILNESLKVPQLFRKPVPYVRVSNILIRVSYFPPVPDESVWLNLNEFSATIVQKPSPR